MDDERPPRSAPFGRLSRAIFHGAVYNGIASTATMALGFVRSVILARWLLPQHFGEISLAMFYVGMAGQVRSLGLDQALMHRSDPSRAVQGTYFTLRVGTVLLSSLLLIAAAPLAALLYPAVPELSTVISVLAGIEIVKGICAVQETWLSKKMAWGRLSLTDVVSSSVMTLVAPALALSGWGVWALVWEQGSGALARLVITWLPFRGWSPRFGWEAGAARWFWGYGRSVWKAGNAGFWVDRFNDLWTGTVLGSTALGYYSRAYEYAHYPRRVVANPLISLVNPVFAHLQGDRRRLSQAFYRAAYIIVRAGFLLAGALALIMPEFIHLVINDQWGPMLLPFRLMLAYALMDSLVALAGTLLMAVGRPERNWHALRVQLLIFVPAVVAGAHFLGVAGVALSADLMLLVGGALLYRYVRQVVDFSLPRLFLWPALGLSAAFAGGLCLERLWPGGASLWALVAAKLALFGSLYLGVLLAAERESAAQSWRWVWSMVRRSDQDA